MSMNNKMQNAMLQGVNIERGRCMAILAKLADDLRKGVENKLMTATQKHLAMVKSELGCAIIAVLQTEVMSGIEPDAEKAKSKILRFDPDALGKAQGNEDGEGAP